MNNFIRVGTIQIKMQKRDHGFIGSVHFLKRVQLYQQCRQRIQALRQSETHRRLRVFFKCKGKIPILMRAGISISGREEDRSFKNFRLKLGPSIKT